MKKILIITLVLLFVSGMLYAQAAKEGTKIGLGISFGKEPVMAMMSTLDFPTFYIPIQVNPTIRIEPELGYFKYSESNSVSETQTIMVYGAGIFYTKWYGKCDLYFGGRIQMYNSSEKYENADAPDMDYEVKESDMVISPALGGECWCCDHVSFGGELQFNYIKFGEAKYDPAPENQDEEKITESVMKFKGLLFIRWWF